MRVKLRNKICTCTKISYNAGSVYLLLSTEDGIYRIKAETRDKANEIYNKFFTDGYYDVSMYQYSC